MWLTSIILDYDHDNCEAFYAKFEREMLSNLKMNYVANNRIFVIDNLPEVVKKVDKSDKSDKVDWKKEGF